MKFTKSHLLSLVYVLFTMLYTIYIFQHYTGIHNKKGDAWWYYLKFLLIDGYLFFIFQYALLRRGDKLLVALLPVITLVCAVLISLLVIAIIGWGGGDLFRNDASDMILLSTVYVGVSIFSIKYLR